jgi:hypothetical protein
MIGHKRFTQRRYKNKNTQLMKSVRGGGITKEQQEFISMNNIIQNAKENPVIKKLGFAKLR